MPSELEYIAQNSDQTNDIVTDENPVTTNVEHFTIHVEEPSPDALARPSTQGDHYKAPKDWTASEDELLNRGQINSQDILLTSSTRAANTSTEFYVSPNSHDDEVETQYDGSVESLQAEENRLLKKMSRSQRKAYFFFEEPKSFWAKFFRAVSYTFIIVSTILVVIETLPVFTTMDGGSSLTSLLFPLETIMTFWWTTELLGLFYASTHRRLFFTKFGNIVDLLSIIPYPLLFIDDPSSLSIVRILRLLRLLRFFKLARYSVGINLAIKAVRRSMDAVWMLFLFILIACMITSTAMFWAERGTWDHQQQMWIRSDGVRSSFNSIPEGFYWSMVTLATVGYGDVVPVTPVGKLIASLTMFFSILTIALPTSIIGSNFMAEYQIFQRMQLQRKVKKNREKRLNVKTVTEKKSEQIKILNEQNALLTQSIGEIQEKLNDINPPQYYQKFKELSTKYAKAKETIETLEKEVMRLKKLAGEQVIDSKVLHIAEAFAAAPHKLGKVVHKLQLKRSKSVDIRDPAKLPVINHNQKHDHHPSARAEADSESVR